MNLGISLTILATLAIAAPHSHAAEEKTVWTMAISVTDVEAPSSPIVEIWAISYDDGELIASCRFANTESPKYRPLKVTIEGEWRDGSFWPAVKAQVGDLHKGPWYSIPFEAKKGKLSKLDVLPGKVMPEWRVRLNDFLPYVDNYEVGRVVLSSGDFAVFDLINLKGRAKKGP
jgi:hypothetical protein